MRLIDADALMEISFSVTITGEDNAIKIKRLMEQYNKAIINAPTIDAEPVVRCKECKWGKPYSDKQLKCNALGLGGLKFPDDFCSYGERREP